MKDQKEKNQNQQDHHIHPPTSDWNNKNGFHIRTCQLDQRLSDRVEEGTTSTQSLFLKG